MRKKKLLDIPPPYTSPDSIPIPMPSINNKCKVESCTNQASGTIDFYRKLSESKEQGYGFCDKHIHDIAEIVLNEIAIFIREEK